MGKTHAGFSLALQKTTKKTTATDKQTITGKHCQPIKMLEQIIGVTGPLNEETRKKVIFCCED